MLTHWIYLSKDDFFTCDYWDNFEKFKEILPSKDKFYNTLTFCAISYINYKHVLPFGKLLK